MSGSRESRKDWDIDRYIDLMDKLYDLQDTMADEVWRSLFVAIKAEMKMKFPVDQIEEKGLDLN